MNEEEARAKLRARLDGWKVYLQDQDAAVSEPSILLERETLTESAGGIEAEKSAAPLSATLSLAVTVEEMSAASGNSVAEVGGIGGEIKAVKSAVLFEPGQRDNAVLSVNTAPLPNRSSVKIVTLGDAPLSFPADTRFDEGEEPIVPLPAYSLQRVTPGYTGRLKVVFLAVVLFAIVGVGAILYGMYARLDG